MTEYRERLTAPPTWWLVAVVFGGICGWIVRVAATPAFGLFAAALGTLFVAMLIWKYGSVTVRVGPDGLHVGPAHLPSEFVGAVTALDGHALRASLGPDADARAWLCTRPYVDGGVRVDVSDPADAVPYWLFSSRRPAAVAAALGRPVGQTET